MNITHANAFLLPACNGLVVGEATMEEWLAAGGSPLALAGLEPMTGPKAPGKYVTLLDDRRVLEFNGLEETK